VSPAEIGVGRHVSGSINSAFERGCAVAPVAILREHLGASRLRSLRSPPTRP
jgi:hypothetical protein